MSLFSRNFKLIPLSELKLRNQLLSTRRPNEKCKSAEDENAIANQDDEETAYYDVKIRNEINQNLDYKIVNSFNPSKSYFTIPIDVKKGQTSKSTLLSSYSLHGDQSQEIKSMSSFISSSVLSNSFNNERKLQQKSNQSYSNPLIVEYVPKGKIITVNVSIVW